MARIKFLLAFIALLICAGGVTAAWFYWKKFAQPEIELNRQIAGQNGAVHAPLDMGKRHFDTAIELVKTGELVSARDRFSYLMQYFPESASTKEAKRILGEINMDLLLSRIPMAGKTEYIVKKGDALLSIARHAETTIDYILRANAKTSEFIFPNESLMVYPLNFRTVIDLKSKTVTVYQEDTFFKEYAILSQNLPAGMKGPLSTTVTERVAWKGDRPVNFTSADYMNCAKWLRTGQMGLFIRQAEAPPEGGESRPFGVTLANSELEELYVILRVGSKVELAK